MHNLFKNNDNYLISALTYIFILAIATSSLAAPAATTTMIADNITRSTTTASSSGLEPSPQPIYQVNVRDVNETLINQTHAQLITEGNGTLKLPNDTETIRTITRGIGIVSIKGTFSGKEILTTEDGMDSATARTYEIARSNKEQGIGKGIAIMIIHTDSTGRLAPLDGIILIGQEEIQPGGRALLTFWEWQSGIPLRMTNTTNIEESQVMNTTTTTDTADNSNSTTAPEEEGGGEEK
jgi:hypothetical protein